MPAGSGRPVGEPIVVVVVLVVVVDVVVDVVDGVVVVIDDSAAVGVAAGADVAVLDAEHPAAATIVAASSPIRMRNTGQS
jgi:hypothetical protein